VEVLFYFLDDYDMMRQTPDQRSLTMGKADQKLFSGKRGEEDGQVRQNSNRDGGLRNTDAANRAVESIPANRIGRG